MESISILPLRSQTKGDYLRRSCKIVRKIDGVVKQTSQLWFDMPSEISCPDDNDCDAYLIALILDAMKEKRDLYVDGNLSPSLLVNIGEFQEYWQTCLPKQYTKVQIVSKSSEQAKASKTGVLAAFSGGIDSLFTVFKNRSNYAANEEFAVDACVSIHGFDIPLKDDSAFQNVLDANKTTLKEFAIPVYPIATNYREIAAAPWSHAHGAALAACMHNFCGLASRCLLGSTFPYNLLNLTWGSNPISDPLLSSKRLCVVHDGAAYTRVEKVAYLKSWEYGISRLRVCWQGKNKDLNCGVCEKCTRTKLNLLACQIEIPDCFEIQELDLNFSHFTLEHQGERVAWQQIVKYATEQGLQGEWIDSARKKSKEKSLKARFFPPNSKRKLLAIKLKAKLAGS